MLINIIVKITTANGVHTIMLPQSQSEFDTSLTSMLILTGDRSEYVINKVISNLKTLNYSLDFAKDIEELNFLAQILDGVSDDEFKVFEAIVIHEDGVVTMQNLINIALHLFDYEIDSSIISFGDLGLKYVKDTMPNSDLCIFNNVNLFGLGIYAQASQHGEFTNLGYISNYHLDFEDIYDGNLFPEYDYDENYILKLRLSKDNIEKGVEFTIPASQNVVNRAMHRLGVSNLDECVITRYSSWDFDAITTAAWMDDNIEELNALVEKIQKIKEDDIIHYLNAVKDEETLISISVLDLFTDFFLLNGFKKHKLAVIKNNNKIKSYRAYTEPFGMIKELLGVKAAH